MSIEVIRLLMVASHNPHVRRVTVRINDKVAAYLNNRKRRDISAMEEEGQMTVQILGTENAYPEFLEMMCTDEGGREVRLPV
jgi:ribonuclease E